MRFNAFPVCNLFHLFFLSNFDVKKFKTINMCVIRDVVIKKHVETFSDDTKEELLRELIIEYDSQTSDNINIDLEFPSDILLKHFSHLIYHYYIENYSLNPLLRNISSLAISNFLKNFTKLNPCFGRKMIISNNSFFIPDKKWKYDDKKNSYYTFVCDVITVHDKVNQKINKKKPIKRKHYNKKNKNKKRARNFKIGDKIQI